MAGRLENKVAIVTGGAMGLGRAIAGLFAREGATVVLTDIKTSEGEAVAASLAKPGMFIRHDVAVKDDWDAVVSRTLERFGKLDILVNNAAIARAGSIEDDSFDDWRRVQSINADSVFLGCKAAVQAMKARGGSIVNIASVASHVGEARSASYSAAKGAVRSLTKSVAVHCKQQGYRIRCNSVHPGVMDTPMVAALRADLGLPPATKKGGDPEQVAYSILYLASDESLLVTGAELLVDDGRTVTPPPPS